MIEAACSFALITSFALTYLPTAMAVSELMLKALVMSCACSTVSAKAIRGIDPKIARKLAASGDKCWLWCTHGHCDWSWGGCQCICDENYEGACCNTEKQVEASCPAQVEREWRNLGLIVTQEKNSSRAYVACDHTPRDERKVSCRSEECGGDAWCFVKAHCGSWWNPCEKRPDLRLNCDVIPLEDSETLGWSFRVGGASAVSPRNREEIVAAVNQSNPPLPAGEGWSWFIGHTTPSQSLLSLRDNWAGLVWHDVDYKIVRVRSGTSFGGLKKYLAEKGRALYDRPQYDELSIGGAVRTVGHGWSGTRFFTESIVAIEGVERGTGKTITASKGDTKFYDVMFDESVVILTVDILTVPDQRICVRQVVEEHPNAIQKLEEHSGGRLFEKPFLMLFVNGQNAFYRSATYNDADDDSMCSSGAQDGLMGSRLIRTIRRHLEIPAEFAESQKISESHTLIETVGVIGQIVTLARGTINFELFSMQRPDLEQAIPAIIEFHKQWGGRTEFRARSQPTNFVVAIDVIMDPTPGGTDAFMQMAHQHLGVTRAYVHSGKYMPPLGPILRMSPSDFWSEVEASQKP